MALETCTMPRKPPQAVFTAPKIIHFRDELLCTEWKLCFSSRLTRDAVKAHICALGLR